MQLPMRPFPLPSVSFSPTPARLATFLPVALVVTADWLFYRHPLGWSVGLFLLAALSAVLLVSRPRRDDAGTWALAAATAAFAAALAIQPGPLAVAMGLGALIATLLNHQCGWTTDTLRWGRRARAYLVRTLTQMPRDLFASSLRVPDVIAAGDRGARTTLRRWALPLLLGGVFVWLFSIANPVIGGWATGLAGLCADALAGLARWLPEVEAARALFWIACAGLVWPLVRGRTAEQTIEPTAGAMTRAAPPAGVVVRSLAVFNAIFLAQSLLDLTYLWGGATLPRGMSYAEYAHRGAYPLVATALLAALFVLVCFRPGSPSERDPRCRVLVLAWIGQNVLLIVSTIWRLALYVDSYSLTRLRGATVIWLGLVAFGFVTLSWRLLSGRSNRWLLGLNTSAALAVLSLSCFADFDSRIAWYNVRHCAEVRGSGPALDVEYLRALGPESLPPLRWYEARVPYTDERHANAVRRLSRDLVAALDDWRGWTLVRHRVRAQLPAEWLDSKLGWRDERWELSRAGAR